MSGNISQELADYISANKDSSGKVNFYSNLYEVDSNTSNIVSCTTSNFKPSALNNFYKFNIDTAVYIDEACQNPLTTEPIDGQTYYYQKEYYDLSKRELKFVKKAIGYVQTSNFKSRYVIKEDKCYIKQGVYRSKQILDVSKSKTQNATNNANYSIDVSWVVFNGNADIIDVHLGNNGLLQFDLPSSLTVSKTVENTITPVNVSKDSFTFTIEFSKNGIGLNNSFYAQIMDSDGNILKPTGSAEYMIKSGDTFTLKHNQKLVVNGLPANVKYTVTENRDYDYYTTTVAKGTESPIQSNTVTGTIPINSNQGVSFTNTYSLTDTSVTIPVVKELTGRKLKSTDSFSFNIAAQNGAPQPLNTQLTLTGVSQTNLVNGSFDAIKFIAPGTYNCIITESAGTISNITYSKANYNVKVIVVYGEFTFNLYEGEILKDSKTNDASGNVRIDAINYNQVGTYNYIIKEVRAIAIHL